MKDFNFTAVLTVACACAAGAVIATLGQQPVLGALVCTYGLYIVWS